MACGWQPWQYTRWLVPVILALSTASSISTVFFVQISADNSLSSPTTESCATAPIPNAVSPTCPQRPITTGVVIDYPLTTTGVVIDHPRTRQVLQRLDECDCANASIRGLVQLPSGVEASHDELAFSIRLIPSSNEMDGVACADAEPWALLPAIVARVLDSTFEFAFEITATLPKGWWYIELSVSATKSMVSTVVGGVVHGPLGVGEVFIVAGQSNSGNWGACKFSAFDRRVTMPDESLYTEIQPRWQPEADPQPTAKTDGSTGGSPWALVSDSIARLHDTPVGIIAVGWGGTASHEWLPESDSPAPSVGRRLEGGTGRLPFLRWVASSEGQAYLASNPQAAQFIATMAGVRPYTSELLPAESSLRAVYENRFNTRWFERARVNMSQLPEQASCRTLHNAIQMIGANSSTLNCGTAHDQLTAVGIDPVSLVASLSPSCRYRVARACRASCLAGNGDCVANVLSSWPNLLDFAAPPAPPAPLDPQVEEAQVGSNSSTCVYECVTRLSDDFNTSLGCDDYAQLNVTCAELAAHGCDCGGCSCPLDGVVPAGRLLASQIGSTADAMDDVVGGAIGEVASAAKLETAGPSNRQLSGTGWNVPAYSGELYSRLQAALFYTGAHGVRAVLWHQGESDDLMGVPMQTYVDNLQTVINASRVNAEWDVPWVVARASLFSSRIINAQDEVIASTPGVFAGPSTNQIRDRYDGVHFNAMGLQKHAHGWLQAVQDASLIPTAPSDVVALSTPSYTSNCSVCNFCPSILFCDYYTNSLSIPPSGPSSAAAGDGAVHSLWLAAMVGGWATTVVVLGALIFLWLWNADERWNADKRRHAAQSDDQRVLTTLIDPREGHLGVTLSRFDGDGVRVEAVHPLDLCARAGLEVGDIVISVDGTRVSSHEDALKLMVEAESPFLVRFQGAPELTKLQQLDHTTSTSTPTATSRSEAEEVSSNTLELTGSKV